MPMAWLDSLRRLFRRTSDTPPPILGGFAPKGLDAVDDMPRVEVLDDKTIALVYDTPPEREPAQPAAPRREWVPPGIVRNQRMRSAGDDLWGVTFAIEYADSRNNVTTRRITLRELYWSDDGMLYLHSMCHERHALRSFRFDRVRAVIDLDGVVHEPRVFFQSELRFPLGDLTVELPPLRPTTEPRLRPARQPKMVAVASVGPEKPGLTQRRAARDGLRVLAALARADGLMHDAEIAVILDYIVERAAADGIETGEDDRAVLLPYLRRQVPSADVLGECLGRLGAEPETMRRLFLRHAVALMDVDGVQHPAEFEMMSNLKERL
jgi:WYL domain